MNGLCILSRHVVRGFPSSRTTFRFGKSSSTAGLMLKELPCKSISSKLCMRATEGGKADKPFPRKSRYFNDSKLTCSRARSRRQIHGPVTFSQNKLLQIKSGLEQREIWWNEANFPFVAPAKISRKLRATVDMIPFSKEQIVTKLRYAYSSISRC